MTRILVRRDSALGDVLEVTAITRRLREENPDAIIDIETAYPQVFERNNDITHPVKVEGATYDRIIELNMSFENQLRKIHPIDAHSEIAFGDRKTLHQIHFNWPQLDIGTAGPPPVVLHAAKSWPIRTLPREFWQKVIDLLVAADFAPILTGTLQDWNYLQNAVDTRGKFTLAQQVALIDAACCFVCSESGPMTLASPTRTPILGLFTMAPPTNLMHLRRGGYAWRWHYIQAKIDCVGCEATHPEPVTYLDCKFGHRKCVDLFDPEEVVAKVKEIQIPLG